MSLSYHNIIVAIDGSEEAEWALKKAVEITKRNDAKLHLVHVLEIRTYPADAESIKKRAEKFGTDLLDKFKKMALELGLEKVNTLMEFGSPKVAITKKIAKKIEADLIICGKTGLNAVEHLFIGSVSENIARSANCDVLIIKKEKNDD